MRPELFRIPLPLRLGPIDSIPIYAYGFFVMVGFLAALWISVRRARAMGIEPDLLVDLGLWVMVSGIFGARVYYVAEFRSDFDWGLASALFRAPVSPEGLLGAIAGIAVAIASLRRKGRAILSLASASKAAGAAFAGAVALHLTVRRSDYDFGLLRIDRGGLVIYGGLIAGAIAYVVFLKRRGASLLDVGDCVAPGIPLGQAFGRLGCFLNGCCFGGVSLGPQSVRFGPGTEAMPNPVYQHQIAARLIEPGAEASLPVHPAQLYASLADFVLFLVVLRFSSRRKARGEAFALYFTAYPAIRFFLEMARDDSARIAGGLTFAQVLSLAGLAAGGAFFAKLRLGSAGGVAVAPPRVA